MNVTSFTQTTGNICTALAVFVFLVPLQRLLWNLSSKYFNDDHWVPSVLYILVPLWLLLVGGLLCVTASGGFDGLRLGRPALYAFTFFAGAALGCVSFVFIALYIRPGFTPRGLYVPVIYLVPLATALLVVLSLNPKLAAGIPIQWLRWPWTAFATLSLVVALGFLGHRFVHGGLGNIVMFVHRIHHARDTSPDQLAKIASLDPQRDFTELLKLGREFESRAVREAATARLRTHPAFAEALSNVLKSRDPEIALEFLHGAVLSAEEQKSVALPARTAIERFIDDIPAPNYMSSERRKQLLKWGRKAFPVIISKFKGTDVDFSKIMPAFEHALRPDDTRR